MQSVIDHDNSRRDDQKLASCVSQCCCTRPAKSMSGTFSADRRKTNPDLTPQEVHCDADAV
jgi:hypothetical protein